MIKKDNYDICILIVLYNKKLNESVTLRNLNFIENSKFIIWNNGPNEFDKTLEEYETINKTFDIIENINNTPLPIVYNTIIKNYSANKYIILDDDSDLTTGYLKSVLLLNEKSIGVPTIKVLNKIVSPSVNGKEYNNSIIIKKNDKVFAITSGLVLGKEIIEIILNSYENVFDENFIIYGADTSLFYRLIKLGIIEKIKIIDGFNHSLSEYEIESDEKSKFRQIEKGSAEGLIYRYYYPIRIRIQIFVKYLFYSIFDFFLNKKLFFFRKYFLISLLKGKHYRK